MLHGKSDIFAVVSDITLLPKRNAYIGTLRLIVSDTTIGNASDNPELLNATIADIIRTFLRRHETTVDSILWNVPAQPLLQIVAGSIYGYGVYPSDIQLAEAAVAALSAGIASLDDYLVVSLRDKGGMQRICIGTFVKTQEIRTVRPLVDRVVESSSVRAAVLAFVGSLDAMCGFLVNIPEP